MEPMQVGAQQHGYPERPQFAGVGNRHVVVLTRGSDEWRFIVLDAISDDAAREQALTHANGYYDSREQIEVPPSNGPAGWQFSHFEDA